jgi:glycerophosphoryl diester phosphodiesterase
LIETKHPVRTGGRIERAVVALLHSRKEEISRSGIEVTVMSFSYFAVRKLKKKYPLVAKIVKYRAATLLSQNEHLAVNIELLRSKRVQKKLLSRQVLLWTVNQEKQLTQAANLKIEGVITDEVTKAKVLLKPSASI